MASDPRQLELIGGHLASLGAEYDLGARAGQIRDDLMALSGDIKPADMLHIQLDDRALFLARWQALLLRLLDEQSLQQRPRRAEFRAPDRGLGTARASVESVGYRLVRAYHEHVQRAVWDSILQALQIRVERESWAPSQFEGPLWTLVTQQPPHLLAQPYASWNEFLLAQVDATLAELAPRCPQLARCTWGARNVVRIRHPLSGALPGLARFLDMPVLQLPGDHDMPRVQERDVGASERFAVSPGHEAEGYFELPGGQSGHPLSPYYRAGFLGWARGEALPFLPGPDRAYAHAGAQLTACAPPGYSAPSPATLVRLALIMNQRFTGTDQYIATDELMMAVNAAIVLARPLLIKGEPGTGKTQLAQEIARALARPLYEWHIKSTSKAQQGLYEYDAVSRLRDSQLGDARVHDIRNYILKGRLWEAFESQTQPVLLIDEIDKADIEFPNDLLRELDRMEFYVYETRELVQARHRPIIIITSNNEKELPDAFLRRCFFHYIRFPGRGHHARHRRRALPAPEARAAGRGTDGVLRGARDPWPEEEALDLGAARLDQAAGGRGHPRRGAAQQRHEEDDPGAARGAAEERAGRAPVRAAGLHAPPRALTGRHGRAGAILLRAAPGGCAGGHHRVPHAARGTARARRAAFGPGLLLTSRAPVW